MTLGKAPQRGSHTTPLELLAWAVVLLCVATALLRHRPRWWLGAGWPTLWPHLKYYG
jgi:hypothetical protein